MLGLFNIIAETLADEGSAASASPESFWDPGSIILCTAGLCILVTWLFWYGGFGALKKAPIRRHRGWVVFCPLAILFLWIITTVIAQMLIESFFHSSPQSTREAISYPVNTILEIGLIVTMLSVARNSFARGLRGFGLRPAFLKKDIPMAVVHILAVFPLILAGLWTTLAIGRLVKGSEFNLDVHQSLELLTNAGVGLQALVIIFAVLVVPIFEELLFRGFLQTSLRSVSGKPWITIVLTSLFFAILHPPTHIPALFMLSCGLGYAYERSGSLFRPILMHVFFNGFSVAVTIFQSS